MGGLALRLLARFGLLGLGIVFALMANASWRMGTPPNWSLLAPREITSVVSAAVQSGRASNGSLRHEPVVHIAWPPGSQDSVALAGVRPSFFGYGEAEAGRIVADYPVGGLTSVRLVEGKPVADRIDLFGLAHALFLSVFAFGLLVAGTLAVWIVGRLQAMR